MSNIFLALTICRLLTTLPQSHCYQNLPGKSVQKSMEMRTSAATWAGHLKDFWERLLGQCLTCHNMEIHESEGMSDEMSTRLSFAKHALQVTVAAIIPLEVQEPDLSGNKEEVGSIDAILEWISSTFTDSVTQQWARMQKLRLGYHRAIASHDRYELDGETARAQGALQEFVDGATGEQHTDLQSMLLIHEVVCKLESEAPSMSRAILEAQIPSSLYILAIPEPALAAAALSKSELRLRLKSYELLFLGCLKQKDWLRARSFMDKLEEMSPGFFTGTVSYTKLWPWQRCLYAGLVLESENRFNDAMLYYTQAWIFFKLVQDYIVLPDQQRAVSGHPDHARLVSALVRRQIRWATDHPDAMKIYATTDKRINTQVFPVFGRTTSEYQGDDHKEEALQFFEYGRPQYIWRYAQSVQQNQDSAAYYQYQAWLELRNKASRSDEEDVEYQDLDSRIEDISARIQASATFFGSGGERELLLDLPGPALRKAIPEDAVAICYATSEDGLIILAADCDQVWIQALNPNLDASGLRTLISMYLICLKDSDTAAARPALDFCEQQLSKFLIEPVRGVILKRHHIIFIPSGELLRVPFGALKFDGEYLGLQRAISQAPSLATLLHLQYFRNATRSRIGTVRVIARPGNPRDKYLPMAGIEAVALAQITGSRALNASNVSRSDFQDHLRDADFLHVGTHGFIDSEHAFNSHILLQNRFRVLDMLAVRSEVSLVTFSACLSGVGRASEAGDLQGFSHALLAAGANAFIGALWKVNDVATMLHMYLFYVHLFAALDRPTLAQAWHKATVSLYELTTESAITAIETLVMIWDGSEAQGRDPSALVKNGRNKLLRLAQDWKDGKLDTIIDFKHPRIWAPFVLIGNGDFRIKSSRHKEFMDNLQARSSSENP